MPSACLRPRISARLRRSVEARAPFAFWILLLAIWAALNTVFLAGDLFTLYVALELLTFAAVPLVSLDGRAETLAGRAALSAVRAPRLGPLSGRHGAALRRLRHARHRAAVAAGPRRARDPRRGRADDRGAARQDRALPAAPVAAARPCRCTGRRQRRPVGAGGEGILLHRRPALVRRDAGAAGLRGHAAARRAGRGRDRVRQRRRAAAGAIEAPDRLLDAGADRLPLPDVSARFRCRIGAGSRAAAHLAGGLLQAISHATAKAAMFMSAGLIYAALGHDRITGWAASDGRSPMSVLAFALAGVALIGVPPSGAYLAKELLLASGGRDRAMVVGGRDPGGRDFHQQLRLAGARPRADAPADEPVTLRAPVPRMRGSGGAGARAVLAVARARSLGPVSSGSSRPDVQSVLEALASRIWPILGGGALAILLGRWGDPGACTLATVGPARRATLILSSRIERIDGVLRQWPAAGISHLVVAIMFGAAMLTGR